MRKIFTITVLFAAILFLGCNNSQKNSKNSGKNVRTTIALSEEMHDFGEIKRGEILKYAFKIKNTGKAELIISRVDVSCGCTDVKYDHQPIGIGNETEVEFTFNSQGFTGNVYKTITVFSNAETDAKEFKFGAYVKPPAVPQ